MDLAGARRLPEPKGHEQGALFDVRVQQRLGFRVLLEVVLLEPGQQLLGGLGPQHDVVEGADRGLGDDFGPSVVGVLAVAISTVATVGASGVAGVPATVGVAAAAGTAAALVPVVVPAAAAAATTAATTTATAGHGGDRQAVSRHGAVEGVEEQLLAAHPDLGLAHHRDEPREALGLRLRVVLDLNVRLDVVLLDHEDDVLAGLVDRHALLVLRRRRRLRVTEGAAAGLGLGRVHTKHSSRHRGSEPQRKPTHESLLSEQSKCDPARGQEPPVAATPPSHGAGELQRAGQQKPPSPRAPMT